jgi:uncharacterized protein YoxC
MGGSMRARDQRGLAGTVLVITIAWALSAVLMLTGILIAAQEIDERVGTILGEVSPIDKDLDAVALAEKTNEIAAGIRRAAEPLSGQLDQVIESVGGIDRTVTDILETAGKINDTAGSINSTVRAIGTTVDGIAGNIANILSTVMSIDGRVAGINARADAVIALVRGIRSDLAQVLAQVGIGSAEGHGSATDATIHGHANSIDCSPVVRLQSDHCGQ